MTEAGRKAGESGKNNWENGCEKAMKPGRERETEGICRQSVAAPSPMRA